MLQGVTWLTIGDRDSTTLVPFSFQNKACRADLQALLNEQAVGVSILQHGAKEYKTADADTPKPTVASEALALCRSGED